TYGGPALSPPGMTSSTAGPCFFSRFGNFARNHAAGVLGSGGAGGGVGGMASGGDAGSACCSGTPLSPAHCLSLSNCESLIASALHCSLSAEGEGRVRW